MAQAHHVALTDQLLRALTGIARDHAPAVFSSSLSIEDMVITDAILDARLDIGIFTIDTGMLHGDTLDLLQRIRERYGREIQVYAPQPASVAAYVERNGRDAYYASPDLRHACCHIRKVEPLGRALRGNKAWVTGLRQVPGAREQLAGSQFDATHDVLKFNPLALWTEADVRDYLRARDVPYNRLYDQGYRSIGCAPCTRPTLPDEDIRAGRWWWEQGSAKECGLHLDQSGRFVRARELA